MSAGSRASHHDVALDVSTPIGEFYVELNVVWEFMWDSCYGADADGRRGMAVSGGSVDGWTLTKVERYADEMEPLELADLTDDLRAALVAAVDEKLKRWEPDDVPDDGPDEEE